MITQDDIDAFRDYNEPLNEKESEEKQKKVNDVTENKEYLVEVNWQISAYL